ncbi:hypothetical protein H4219_005066 [Mycoemilia scoparia]|uniref:RNA helicase n=1 Tax=Mycoemilia scoparia TaxID=417184 RepID=A0A9W7ZZ15_9FUNG|nr:hypothetical protein H4219_005066 [Mycoemilia scoparia]
MSPPGILSDNQVLDFNNMDIETQKLKNKEAEVDPATPSKKSKDKKSKKEKSEKKKSSKDKKRKSSSAKSSDGEDSDSSKKSSKNSSNKRVKEHKEQDVSEAPSASSKSESDSESEKDPNHLDNFNISQSTKNALQKRGINALFPIQAKTLVPILEGNDVLGRARTGTGKTLAFSLPIVEKLISNPQNSQILTRRGRAPRAIILAPTRELANQVTNELSSLNAELSVACFYGGSGYDKQNQAIWKGLDVVVGTPGRVIDHLNSGKLKCNSVEFLCLDEADQMLDIGFKDDMETVLNMVKEQREEGSYQTLLFSATVPEWIGQITRTFMRPGFVKIDLVGSQTLKTSETIEHFAIQSSWQARRDVVADVVAVYGKSGRTIIFTETKRDANELALHDKLSHFAQVLHGDIAQSQREVTLQGFRDGNVKVLICTDVAARGLDIPEVDLVINSEQPKDIETYIHRSGRTGRAGRSGTCVTCFKPMDTWWVDLVRRKAGINCQVIQPPNAKDIISVTGQEAATKVSKCNLDAADLFTDTASKLVDDKFKGDAVKALSAALAHIAGYAGGVKSRSLLSGLDSDVTMVCTLTHEIRGNGYVRGILTRHCPNLSQDDCKAFRMSKDHTQVVFDVRADLVEECTNENNEKELWIAGTKWVDSTTVTMGLCEKLPELEEREFSHRAMASPGGRFSRARSGGSGRRGGASFSRGGGSSFRRGGGGSRGRR